MAVRHFDYRKAIEGNAVRVAEADTVIVLIGDQRNHRIRMAGVDVPKRIKLWGWSPEAPGALSGREGGQSALLQGPHLRPATRHLFTYANVRLLSEAEIGEIASIMEMRKVPAGRELFRDGDPGDGLYLVACGEVDIVKRAANRERRLTRLGPGAIFDEISAVTRDARTATVRAAAGSSHRGRRPGNALIYRGIKQPSVRSLPA